MNGWRGWISAVDIGGPVVPSAANYNIPSAPPWAVVVVRGLGRHAISCQIGAPDYDRFHPRLQPQAGIGKNSFFLRVIPFPRPLARPSLEKRGGYSTRSHDSSCGEDNSEGIQGGLRVLDMRVHRISRKALTEAGGSLLSSRVLSDTLYTSLANLPPFTACYQCYVTRFQPRTRDNIAIRNRRNERCTQPRAYHFVSQKRSLLARFTAISAQYAKLLPIHFSIQNLEETKRLWKRYGRDTLTHTHVHARVSIALQPFLQLGGILQSSRRGLRTVERPLRKAGRRKGRTIAASSGLLRSQRIVNIAGPGMRAQDRA